MSFSIEIKRSALKALQKLPPQIRSRLMVQIEQLAQNPKPQGCRKLSGRDAWRVRVGDYRVIYEVHEDKLVIVVIAIGHRKEVYR